MPDKTPDTKKAALSPSFCAKAAGTAFALAVAIFMCLYLVATFPGKGSSWQSALPKQGMTSEDAGAALVRAKYLHEAEVRPKLIKAGFLSDDDIAARQRGWYSQGRSKSLQMSEILWGMRAFPELHAIFLAKLTDTSVSPDDRETFFYAMGGFLATMGDAVIKGENARDFRYRDYRGDYGRSEKAYDWFTYYAEDPRLNIRYRNHDGYYTRRGEKTPSAEEKKTYEHNLAFAKRVLPFVYEQVLSGLEEYAAERKAQAEEMEKKLQADEAKHRRREDMRKVDLGRYLEKISDETGKAVAIMAAKKDDSGFFPLVKELLASKEGSLEQRFAAVSLLADRPGLPISEYLFWQKYAGDFRSISSCVGTSPTSYAYLIGCCDKLGVLTKNMLKEQGSFIIGGQEGPGVTMTRAETFLPAENTSGNLYLLADMSQALKNAPAYDLSRAIPVFQGHLFRYLKNQPLVLPLNPKNAGDAALIAWYSDKGWKAGRTVLFSATGSPSQVAAHWASIHLLWWPSSKKKADEEPDLAYMHPESGHFWLAVLPNLKGKAVSRFLGPVTALWFGRETVDKNGWLDEKYEARPETAPSLAGRTSPLSSPILEWATGNKGGSKGGDNGQAVKKPYSEATATVVLGKEIRSATSDTFVHAYRIALSKHLDKKYPDEKTPPLATFAFVNATMEMLNEWKITSARDVTAASEYLWRFRNDTAIEKRIRDILSNEDLRPYERLRKVRRALGLPAEKNTRGGC